jgi:hypothetical protein
VSRPKVVQELSQKEAASQLDSAAVSTQDEGSGEVYTSPSSCTLHQERPHTMHRQTICKQCNARLGFGYCRACFAYRDNPPELGKRRRPNPRNQVNNSEFFVNNIMLVVARLTGTEGLNRS